MDDSQLWDVIVIVQERGTKRNVSHSLGGFPDRESAVKTAQAFELDVSRPGARHATIESPDGGRLTIECMDFRATKVQKFFSGLI